MNQVDQVEHSYANLGRMVNFFYNHKYLIATYWVCDLQK